jgi:hypothetical protein
MLILFSASGEATRNNIAIGKIDHSKTARHPSQKACGGGEKNPLDYD